MDFSKIELSAEHERLRTEIREFVREYFTPDAYEHEHETGDAFNERIHLALGERGWIQPTWPKERGGAGLDRLGAKILDLELKKTRLPMIALGTTDLVSKAVERYGNPKIRDEVLAGVAKGTVRFSLGYTEPDGGSDIAGAKTKAVRDGDEWIINGSKMFTTGAHTTQYTFLITRTDPTQPKHKGLTMFLLPLDLPGVEIQGIWAYSGERTNIVYYDDVHVSDEYRLGEVNGGWSVLHGPLDEEHSIGGGADDGLDEPSIGTNFIRDLAYALDDTAEWARAARADGSRPADEDGVLERIGALTARYEAAVITPGPAGRVAGAETLVEGSAELLDLIGRESLISRNGDGAIGNGQIDYAHRYAQGTATYAGTVEVFRTIIAQHVLGLPRPNYPGSRDFGVSASTKLS